MSLSLNFGNDGLIRLKWRILLISLPISFQKWFYCIPRPWKPWYRAHLYHCINNILRVMAQFIIVGNGGHFRLKKGFPKGWFRLKKISCDLACQGSHWTPNLVFIENVRVHVNSYWTISAITDISLLTVIYRDHCDTNVYVSITKTRFRRVFKRFLCITIMITMSTYWFCSFILNL